MNICVGGELNGQVIEKKGVLRTKMYINIIKIINFIINSNIYLKSGWPNLNNLYLGEGFSNSNKHYFRRIIIKNGVQMLWIRM